MNFFKKLNFWKALQIGSYILTWLEKSSKDGKITPDEVLDLMAGAINRSGMKIDIDLPEK